MKDLASVLSAVATLLWPAVVIGLLLLLRKPLAELILSAKSRKFTIKVAGQELTMDEASEQQRSLISDLQAQVAELKKVVGTRTPVSADVPQVAAVGEPSTEQLTSVLWVDDYPKNNSYFVEQLNRFGVQVDVALTTAEGMARFGNHKYSVVISDMGRMENGLYNSSAGLDLVKSIRALDQNVPIVVFCSRQAAQRYGAEVVKQHARITSSPTELYGLLNLDRLRAA